MSLAKSGRGGKEAEENPRKWEVRKRKSGRRSHGVGSLKKPGNRKGEKVVARTTKEVRR